MKDRLTTAPQPLERPQGNWNGPQGFWNARRLLERPQATGTREAQLERPVGLLERALAHLERPQGYFVLFVGRRYYLRPNPLLHPPPPTTGTREALLELPLATGPPAGG